MCRVKQLPKEDTTATHELKELWVIFDSPFHASSDTWEEGHMVLSVVPAPGMPEEGWVVDIEKCACACKFYSKLKTCCHISVGRKAKRRQNRKLFNRQVRKIKVPCKKKKTFTHTQPSNTDTAIPLSDSVVGRPLLTSRALGLEFILCPDT
ncbi:hypothetical protein PHMEG_00012427 [Phytophthora megakarya]|uniref:SWIM-type domain-containing protein n=1 Tax=Phytophthora megakarya TaxID=4795 RepID=A0A225WAG2_9STRA|nr:hypothetical protein PHMEG_00012427 [Phytophthora megakarya]